MEHSLCLCPAARICLAPVKFLLFVSCCQRLLGTCKIPSNGKALPGHWSYSLGFALIAKCLHPLIIFLCFTGTARLPEASENPLLLKQVVRKPLEAVLRYLGIKQTKPSPAKPPKHRNTLLDTLLTIWVFPLGPDLAAHSGLKTNKQETRHKKLHPTNKKLKTHLVNLSFLLFLLYLAEPLWGHKAGSGTCSSEGRDVFAVASDVCGDKLHLLVEAPTACFGNI